MSMSDQPGREADPTGAAEPTPVGAPARHRHAAPAPTPDPDGDPTTSQTGRPERRSGTWGTSSHVLVAVLCALLGFAIVVQVRQTQSDELASLRQDDLVRLLDEITLRNDQLETEQSQLLTDRTDLATGADAQEVAQRNAEVQGILAGTVPVQGPGIQLVVTTTGPVPASAWVNVVEELRNAGAEAIEIGGVRVGASTWFADATEGLQADGVTIASPVVLQAIGDPQTLEVALGIPGGALATLRTYDATTSITSAQELQIRSVRELRTPEVASPAPEASPSSG